MFRYSLIGIALLLIASNTKAFSSYSLIYYIERLPLNGKANCESPMTTRISKKACVEKHNFIKTAYGGRVPMVVELEYGPDKETYYGSFIQEVNCKSMEERSANKWSFTKADMSSAPKDVGWKKQKSIWFIKSDEDDWSEWKPVTYIRDDYKWICDNYAK